MENIEQYINRNGLKIESKSIVENPNNPEWTNADHWISTISGKNSEMDIYYSKGKGHCGNEPNLPEVISTIAYDSVIEDMEFEEFCNEYGYECDEFAMTIFEASKRNTENFKELVGEEEFEKLINDVELE